MNGVAELKQMQEAGFSDAERQDWMMGRRKQMGEAGFRDDEIDSYFGQPPFNRDAATAYAQASLEQATKPTTDGTPKPVTDFTDVLKAGFGDSITGILTQGKPTTTISPDAPRMTRIAGHVMTLAGDSPAIAGGFFAGGGPASPVTGMAGAVALQQGMRKVLMDSYEKKEVTSFGDFWDRFSGAFIDTFKGYITGLATGAVGKAVGLAPIASPTVKTATTLASEITTMVTVGKALEGQIPEPDDFIDTALTLGFVKGTTKAATKLRDIYKQTGVKPDEVASDAVKDPTILHDLASETTEVPHTYRPKMEPTVEDIHAQADKKGVQWDNAPAFMDFTEQLTGKRHLDELTPAERANVSTALEEWQPDRAMAGGAPSTPLNDAQQKVLDRLVLKDPDTAKMSLSDIYTSVVDNLNPIKQALKAGGKEGLETAADPYTLERLTRGVAGKASEFLNAGAFDFSTYKTTTKGYFQILDPVKKDLDGFRAYLVAKRAVEKAGQGVETGIPLEEAKQVVREGREKYEAIHQERLKYRNALLDTLQQSGILSAKSVEAMKEANKDYVPFYRFFEDEQGRPSTAASVRNPIKKMMGSERQILDPILSDIKDTFLFVALAEKNAARQAYVQLGPEFAQKQKQPVQATHLTEPEIRKLFNEFVTARKETQKKKQQITTTTTETGEPLTSKQQELIVQRVRQALLDRGFQPGEADQMIRRVGEAESGKIGTTVEKIIKEVESTTYLPEIDIRLPNEVATVFRSLQRPARQDEIAVYTKGHRDLYTVDPKVAEAFNGLDRGTTGLLAKIAFAPASLLRAGVTITPDFIMRNMLRDAVSAFIYAGSNPLKTAKGLKSLITEDDAYHKWLKGGGAQATMVAIDRDYLQQHLGQLNAETGLMRRAWNVAKTPLDLLRATSELVENSTRLGAVRSELQRTQDKARIQALSLIAREATVDFGRHGRDTEGYARSTAFFNPAIQGIDRFMREMKAKPLATTAKAMATVTLPSVLLWYANKDDKEIQDLPRWQKDLFWVTRVPLPEGKSFIMRIPKPQEFGILFGTMPERLLDRFVADNPDALRDIHKSLIDAFTPSLVPTAAMPIISQFANRDTFTGSPLIPVGQESLLPEYQYTPYTTETAKAIGQLIGAFPGVEQAAVRTEDPFIGGVARALSTPILLENYLRAWTGGMGTYLLQLADKGLREAKVVPDPILPASTLADIPFVKAFIVRYPAATSQSIQDFYNDYDVSKRYHDTILHLAQQGDPRATRLLETHGHDMAQLTSLRQALNDQGKLIRDIYKNPQITPDEQRQLIDTLYYRMIELAHSGNATLKVLKATMDAQK